MSGDKSKRRAVKHPVVLIALALSLVIITISLGGCNRGDDPPIETQSGTDSVFEEMFSYLDDYYSGKAIALSAGGNRVHIDAATTGIRDTAGLRQFYLEKGSDSGLVDSFLEYLGSVSPRDEEYIKDKIEELADMSNNGRDSYFVITQEGVRIIRGVSKTDINTDTTLGLVINAIESGNYGVLRAAIKEDEPEDPNWGLLESKVNTEPENAQYILSEDGLAVLMPETVGTSVDIEMIKADYHNGSWSEKVFPIEEKMPDITVENIKTKLFGDVLSSYTTYYNKNDFPRTNNLVLSSQAINGTVILPGERFSFNKVVGQRTAAKGYQAAPIFTGASLAKELGGGICQVASTLYCATLCENLKQVTRYYHSQTVTYVPLGMDATIYWGSADYVFENNTDNPIMISFTCINGSLTAKILGKQTVDIRADFKSEIVETYASPFNDTLVGSMAPGESVIVSAGKDGYLVYLYRTLTINGVEQEETQINTSRYIPTPTKRNVGPAMTTAPETTAETTQTTPPETTAAVTDAEPPPG